ncbi:hypothetical protein ACHRV5_11015 [Flavobacterium sp. FlaQc-52]|uniref:hypothetical protein n=1 Tax=Flavobacterium sp. FlaQc-52 TaxID=3374185 RepID=UPI003756ED67
MRNISLILFLTIMSCSTDKKVVTLRIENEQIYFVDSTNTVMNYNYNSSESRSKSENIITYVISNETDKKLLFIIDKKIYPSVEKELTISGSTYFVIKDKVGEIKKYNMPLVSFDREVNSNKIYSDSIKNNYYNKIGVENKNIDYVANLFENSIIIGPGERKTFKAIVNFPIISEINSKQGINPLYYRGLKDAENFQIYYSCNAKSLMSCLPKYVRNELNDNEVEIFEGIIESNEVPLKLVK